MNILLMSCTNLGYECFKTIRKKKACNITGICTIPKNFKISYSKKYVNNCNFYDFRKLGKNLKIPTVEFTSFYSKEYLDFITKCNPDLILAIGWYYIIPKKIRDCSSIATLGLHASLLPKYRGGAPLVWAMINGEKETGVSLFEITEGVDNGRLFGQKKFKILRSDYIEDVLKKAQRSSCELLSDVLPKIANNNVKPKKQKESHSTYFPQRRPEDGNIDWSKSVEEIYNFIRAQSKPYPGVFTYINKKKTILFQSNIEHIKRLKAQLTCQL